LGVIQIRFLEHVTKYITFTKEKYGCRTKLTTENAIYKSSNEVLNAMNSILIVGAIFCDLEKF
jgi:hypothetical protein